jgi:hypothetical protein
MRIACKCEKCKTIFMQDEDELCLEIDFSLQRIIFVCRNKNCLHENIIDFQDWKKKQQHSPLPRPRMGSI